MLYIISVIYIHTPQTALLLSCNLDFLTIRSSHRMLQSFLLLKSVIEIKSADINNLRSSRIPQEFPHHLLVKFGWSKTVLANKAGKQLLFLWFPSKSAPPSQPLDFHKHQLWNNAKRLCLAASSLWLKTSLQHSVQKQGVPNCSTWTSPECSQKQP